ncbi:peptide deformylase, mitochondrial-like [Vanessa tameamea]|uniref:Peptide deformylase n=1 Tax=Vanessa tameamea TaxID=334116 RepID=A0A8B8HZE8_VANTA|nr:peptide deformylase, mitochondrial-like [Vanessa tameamea]
MGLLRKTINWYAKLAPGWGRSLPPYEHVVQIGDPILRKVSEPVPVDKIKTDEIQKVIQKLKYVLDKYGSVGMAAPQIGVNLRIFVMRLTATQIAKIPAETIKLKNMSVVPLTVFVNPKLKVVDYNKIIHSEGCESVRSFSADVARYNEVQVKGYNADGEEILHVFKGWPARIAQHEMDHLDGKLYTDIMDRKSLHCICWDEVNLSKGKIVIPFCPQ